jgi:hypothetical protein
MEKSPLFLPLYWLNKKNSVRIAARDKISMAGLLSKSGSGLNRKSGIAKYLFGRDWRELLGACFDFFAVIALPPRR